MADNIDMTGGRANMAFLGDRNDIWHRMGQEMKSGMDTKAWAKAAGLEWSAIKVPAIAALEGSQFDHIKPSERFRKVQDRFHVVRSDNGHPLGYVSNRYEPVQPSDVLGWFERYIGVDDRFKLDVAGSLKQGEIIWATATFNDGLKIAGEKHVARILMTTTYDGTGSTINQGTMTRVVCNNTLNMALCDKRAVIRTRHNTKFDPAAVGAELASIAQGFAVYKGVGDALANVELTKEEVRAFFRECLEIPLDATKEEVSPRKQNQFSALSQAYTVSKREGAADGAWAALQAITRYVDHDRTKGDDEKTFTSAQFGSGATMKATAMNLLLPRIKDKVLISA